MKHEPFWCHWSIEIKMKTNRIMNDFGSKKFTFRRRDLLLFPLVTLHPCLDFHYVQKDAHKASQVNVWKRNVNFGLSGTSSWTRLVTRSRKREKRWRTRKERWTTWRKSRRRCVTPNHPKRATRDVLCIIGRFPFEHRTEVVPRVNSTFYESGTTATKKVETELRPSAGHIKVCTHQDRGWIDSWPRDRIRCVCISL